MINKAIEEILGTTRKKILSTVKNKRGIMKDSDDTHSDINPSWKGWKILSSMRKYEKK